METNCPNVLGSRELSEVWAAWRENKQWVWMWFKKSQNRKTQQHGQSAECQYLYLFRCNIYERKREYLQPLLVLTCMPQTWVCKVSGAGFLCVLQRSPGLSWASERGSCGWSWQCRAAGSRPLRPPAQEPPPPPGWWSSPGGTEKRQSRKQQLSDAGVWVLFIS